jgi:hypothetical protein
MGGVSPSIRFGTRGNVSGSTSDERARARRDGGEEHAPPLEQASGTCFRGRGTWSDVPHTLWTGRSSQGNLKGGDWDHDFMQGFVRGRALGIGTTPRSSSARLTSIGTAGGPVMMRTRVDNAFGSPVVRTWTLLFRRPGRL